MWRSSASTRCVWSSVPGRECVNVTFLSAKCAILGIDRPGMLYAPIDDAQHMLSLLTRPMVERVYTIFVCVVGVFMMAFIVGGVKSDTSQVTSYKLRRRLHDGFIVGGAPSSLATGDCHVTLSPPSRIKRRATKEYERQPRQPRRARCVI